MTIRRSSLLISLVLALSFGQVCFAQSAGTPQLFQFSRQDNYKIDVLTGAYAFPDTVRSVQRIDGVSYKNDDSLWDVNPGKNAITFKRNRAIGSETKVGTTKKTVADILDIIQTTLNPSVSRALYTSSPVVFGSDDSRCATPNYRPYCHYQNSVIVFFPFLFQNLPVYHEDGSTVGLAVVVDEYSGEYLYIRGLINQQTESVTLPTPMSGSSADLNAYIMAGRFYDQENYLIPAHIDTSVRTLIDLSAFGFNPTSGVPVMPVVVAPPTVVTAETTVNGKTYLIGALKVTVPQTGGLTSAAVARLTTRFTGIRLSLNNVYAGQLLVLKKSSVLYKNNLIRLGGTLLYESDTSFVVLFYNAGVDRDALMTAAKTVSFQVQ